MKRILIIEDDGRIAQNISRGLQQVGYRTYVCYDGLEGQTAALTESVDLILLDINLPSLGGLRGMSNGAAGKAPFAHHHANGPWRGRG